METAARKTSTATTRKFREKWLELGYRRMELVADVQSIRCLREVAKARNLATWSAFDQAVKLLVQWHNESIAGKES